MVLLNQCIISLLFNPRSLWNEYRAALLFLSSRSVLQLCVVNSEKYKNVLDYAPSKMNCDMCGKEENFVRSIIEGSELNVCTKCAKYGKVLGNIARKPFVPKMDKSRTKEAITIINPHYATLIKQKREQLGLKQEDLAKALSEKESVVQKTESGAIPPMELARKFESFLKIKLIEEYREEVDTSQKNKTAELTLGDFIKIKK